MIRCYIQYPGEDRHCFSIDTEVAPKCGDMIQIREGGNEPPLELMVLKRSFFCDADIEHKLEVDTIELTCIKIKKYEP